MDTVIRALLSAFFRPGSFFSPSADYYVSAFTDTAAATTNQFQDVATLTLPAGDWDVTFNYLCKGNAATITECLAGISTGTTGNSFSDRLDGSNSLLAAASVSLPTFTPVTVATYRVVGPATVLAKVRQTYSAGAPLNSGAISARRQR